MTSNGNNDPDRVDWNQAIRTHTWQPNSSATPFRWNTIGGTTAAQMGASGYDPLSASGQGMSGTDARYQVRSGDSLAGIAQALWGDASLWYQLAQANGISSDGQLAAGQAICYQDNPFILRQISRCHTDFGVAPGSDLRGRFVWL